MILHHLIVGPLKTNCYLVADAQTKKAAVIDPGDGAEQILDAADAAGVEIETILLTHSHFDHIMAVNQVKEKTGATIVLHQTEKHDYEQYYAENPRQYFLKHSDDIKCADTIVDGDKIKIGGMEAEFIHTPGHTRGSCTIKIEDCLFSGDTLFYGDCGRCDLPGGDYGNMLASLKKLSELEGDFKVYPGHGEFSTLEAERRNNYCMLQAQAQ